MTPMEAMDAFNALRKTIGPKADISVFLGSDTYGKDKNALCSRIYPKGVGSGSICQAHADDFQELYDNTVQAWADHSSEFRRRLIRSMALEIISITAEQGSCSDAALRADKFSAEDVRKYGAEACAEANDIAGRGPFEIVTLAAAANAA